MNLKYFLISFFLQSFNHLWYFFLDFIQIFSFLKFKDQNWNQFSDNDLMAAIIFSTHYVSLPLLSFFLKKKKIIKHIYIWYQATFLSFTELFFLGVCTYFLFKAVFRYYRKVSLLEPCFHWQEDISIVQSLYKTKRMKWEKVRKVIPERN